MNCNNDCFNCIYDDCILEDDNDVVEKASIQLDIEVNRQRKEYLYQHINSDKYGKYNHSKKGIKTRKKYENSDKGKSRKANYYRSDKGKENFYRYNHSEKGKANAKRYSLKLKYKRRLDNMSKINKAQYLIIKNYSLKEMQNFIEGIYKQGLNNAAEELAMQKVSTTPIYQRELLKTLLLSTKGIGEKKVDVIIDTLQKVMVIE